MTDTQDVASGEAGCIHGVHIRVFGGITVHDDAGPISIGGPRQRRLLALLVARAGYPVTVDWIAEHLWADDERPPKPEPSLRTYLSRLRHSLPESAQHWIETTSSGYRLNVPDELLEHRRFGQLRTAATAARGRGDPLAAQRLLDDALALYRGEPFPELGDLQLARADIEQLRLDRLEVLEERWEAALALGRHTQITGELAVFTAEHQLRDRATRQYALALYRSGRATEALRVLADHRRVLNETAGLDPTQSLVELEQAMLAGDPTLDVEQVGRPLRGYRLLEEIGSGSFSVVWRGVQPSVDREVAIKQIRSDLASQPEFIRRFETEAHLIAHIEHPHIVPIVDFWRDPDSAYLVMRLLRGGTLERRLDDGRLSVEQTLRVAHQIGGALSAAHAHGIIHRDVKTGNILFDEAENAFLADFGIALDEAQSAGPEAALSTGSPAYSSPEQIRRLRLGPEADVFSLGVVLYECLAGRLPFSDSASVEQLLDRQLHESYPALADLATEVPTSVAHAIARATSKNASDRWATVDDFLRALESDPARTSSGDATNTAASRLMSTLDVANPYKGLHAFDDADAAQFFGRERLVNELVGRLEGASLQSRGIVVVGPSGSGKSSVVRAGLVPALRAEAVAGSSQWFQTTMVPGDAPFEALEAALLRVAVNPPDSLLTQLRDGERGVLRSLRRCLGSDHDRVLLVIDQFEEIFSAPVTVADQFLAALAVALEDPMTPLRLVATLRADYYHRPLVHPKFARVLKECAVDVTPLAADEMERAIVEPARLMNVHFEPGLSARIAAESLGQPAPLPLLQYVLSELFDRRGGDQLTGAAYDELGGLSGALAARAESLYSACVPAEQTAVRTLFGRMTSADQVTADLRRRVPLADVGHDADTTAVIERFGAARLFTFDRDPSTREPTVEVAHEALLREWPRLAGWLREDAEVLRSAGTLAAAATTWHDSGREPGDLYRAGRLENALDLMARAPERLRSIDVDFVDASRAAAAAERASEAHRVRRLRRLVVGVGFALVLALFAGGVAVVQQRRADDESRIARGFAAEAELATIISRSAGFTTEDPELSILLALEAHRRAPSPATEQAVFNALGSSPIANRVSSVPLLFAPSEPCRIVSPYGSLEFGVLDTQLAVRDPLTGRITSHGPSPEPCVVWVGDEALNRRIVGGMDGRTIWLGPYDGPSDVERDLDEPAVFLTGVLPSNRVLLAVQARATLMVIDTLTGEQIGETLDMSEGGTLEPTGPRAPSTADGSRVAVGLANRTGSQTTGVNFVLDMVTGEQLLRFTTPFPTVHMKFDDSRGEIVALQVDGSLTTIDAETGDLISTVATGAADVLDLGIRADGLVVLIAPGEARAVDRRTGEVAAAVELRDVGDARLRPDGLLQVLRADNTIEVVDINGNALIERAYEVANPFSDVTIEGGLAAIVDLGSGDATMLDLSTGIRSPLGLPDTAGDALLAEAVYPDAGGVWALTRERFSRFEDDELVTEVGIAPTMVWGRKDGDSATVILSDFAFPETRVAQLIALNADDPGLKLEVEAPDAVVAHPGSDGGMYVIDRDGMLNVFDSAGRLLREVDTGIEATSSLAVDAGGNHIAAGGHGVAIVELSTGEVDHLRQVNRVSKLAFARDGDLLVINGFDGTIRLWDVARGVSAGLAWRGSGHLDTTPYYDAATDSVWAASSGKILQIRLDPQRWIERACEIVGRDLTQDEWDLFIPGADPLQSACA